MMAKKFMFVCIGIMALAVTFHVGAMYGRAETIVDQTGTGIVAVYGSGYIERVLLDNGEVWYCDGSANWEPVSTAPPIPPSEIKFWTSQSFVSSSNELWRHFAPGWRNFGAPPMGPTSTQPATWGKVKAEWRK